MALAKFTWQNGTQIEPAKVEVGGVSYNVTDAQYEGETPLSAGNLNLMQDTLLGNVEDDLSNDTKIPSVKAIKNTYSTTSEKIVGTWTDGKPLYRKVCTLACGNNTQTVIAHGITNANIKKIIGSATNGSTTITAGFNDEFYMNNTNVSWNTKLDRRAYTATIIIEYTKTTD